MMYVDDVEERYRRAVAPGAKIVEDLGSPWGLPFYVGASPEGNHWTILQARPTMRAAGENRWRPPLLSNYPSGGGTSGRGGVPTPVRVFVRQSGWKPGFESLATDPGRRYRTAALRAWAPAVGRADRGESP